MIKIDVISNSTFNKNNIKVIQNFKSGITRFMTIKNSFILMDYILDTESDYIFFINKNEKLSKDFLNTSFNFALKNNNFNSVISTFDQPKLSLTGKLIPTSFFKQYINDEKTIELTKENINFIMYMANELVMNIPGPKNIGLITYKKSILELCDSLLELDKLEKQLIQKEIYNQEKFKKAYFDLIVQKYCNVKKSISINKPFDINRIVFCSLYCLYFTKFNDKESFKELLEKNKKYKSLVFDQIDIDETFEFIGDLDQRLNKNKNSTNIQSKVLSLYKNLL